MSQHTGVSGVFKSLLDLNSGNEVMDSETNCVLEKDNTELSDSILDSDEYEMNDQHVVSQLAVETELLPDVQYVKELLDKLNKYEQEIADLKKHCDEMLKERDILKRATEDWEELCKHVIETKTSPLKKKEMLEKMRNKEGECNKIFYR